MARLIILVSLLGSVFTLIGTSCFGDCFFEMKVRVTDCSSSAPLAGVDVTVHIDEGIRDPETLATHFTSGGTGLVEIATDEICDATVTLTFTKSGFASLAKQFKGRPSGTVPLCLMPEP